MISVSTYRLIKDYIYTRFVIFELELEKKFSKRDSGELSDHSSPSSVSSELSSSSSHIISVLRRRPRVWVIIYEFHIPIFKREGFYEWGRDREIKTYGEY